MRTHAARMACVSRANMPPPTADGIAPAPVASRCITLIDACGYGSAPAPPGGPRCRPQPALPKTRSRSTGARNLAKPSPCGPMRLRMRTRATRMSCMSRATMPPSEVGGIAPAPAASRFITWIDRCGYVSAPLPPGGFRCRTQPALPTTRSHPTGARNLPIHYPCWPMRLWVRTHVARMLCVSRATMPPSELGGIAPAPAASRSITLVDPCGYGSAPLPPGGLDCRPPQAVPRTRSHPTGARNLQRHNQCGPMMLCMRTHVVRMACLRFRV